MAEVPTENPIYDSIKPNTAEKFTKPEVGDMLGQALNTDDAGVQAKLPGIEDETQLAVWRYATGPKSINVANGDAIPGKPVKFAYWVNLETGEVKDNTELANKQATA